MPDPDGLTARPASQAREAGPADGTSGSRARLLICDDSATYATALRRVLERDGDITVAAVTGSAEEALAELDRVRPDLITMDIELPGMDGLAAVEEIMSSRPAPILVISSYVGQLSRKAAAALAAGALDALAKDDLDLDDPDGAAGAAFRQRVRILTRARVIRHPRARLRPAAAPAARARAAAVIGVCSSTGGPQVLARMLAALPAGYQIPVLVVQHIAPGFTGGLMHWLGECARLPVRSAGNGVRAGPGIWIAPEGAHLKLTASGTLILDRQAAPGGHRPSGDVLFNSIAAATGSAGVAIVLSGMGSDGAEGAAAVQRRGGLAIALDEASSAVFGMPRAAIERGVREVLSADEIPARLLALRYRPILGAAR